MKWTREQQQVIDLRHRDLLVSAAAGSGKTAVLVERILSLVTDPEHPVDIDRLLVVTFTRAAAGEMKERIGRALEERLAEDPGNSHLQKQGILLHHAQINTIDGFCTFVLRNYFHRIELDPGYRIAEEDDLKLLRGKVLEALLEEEYAEGREEFLHFAEAYGRGKTDRRIAELIPKVYDFAVSDPDPNLWLQRSLKAYEPQTEEEIEESVWMRELVAEAGRRIEGLLQNAVQLRDFVREHPEAPQGYLPALQSDVSMLAELTGKTSYRALHEALAEQKFARLGNKKQPDVDPACKEQVKKQRDRLKKLMGDLQDAYFGQTPEQILEDLACVRPQAAELVRLVGRFADAYTAAKRKRNMIDFSDLEHLALEILTEREEGGSRRPTAAAEELAERFAEVMVDEYQDSNFLQEAILSAVSKTGEGTGNRFMVGDIKQSIYGFRRARPELFLDKVNTFHPAEEEGPHGVRIDLHRNFRSRPQVLETANALFAKLMVPELGGIVYDEAAALHPAAEYPVAPDPGFPETELLIVDKSSPEFDEDRSRAAMVEAEAHLAAGRIRECLRSGKIWDAKEQNYRPVQYRDCVILLRAAGAWGDTYVRVLQSEGIPAYTASGKGYFTTPEITTVLNVLRVCDNPAQDIPLAAVLRSPIGGMRDSELARLRIESPEGTLLEALRKMAAAADRTGTGEAGTERAKTGTVAVDREEESLTDRAARFLEQLDSFRERVPHTTVHVLIRQILAETGYGDYAAALPAGAQRQANLEMLAERAAAYEKNDAHGLFQFVRYVEQLTEREVDFGEVSLYGEEENIVRIMTIHKSKGLEFPIVILAGLGSRFNLSDEKDAVLLHARLGFGMTAVYTEQHRIHTGTALRAAVKNAVRHDNLSEELRVLYVAVTRAREKLILIGTGDGREAFSEAEGNPAYPQLISARSCLDWILMAADSSVPVRKTMVTGEQMVQEEVDDVRHSDGVLREIGSLLREGRPGDYAPDVRQRLAAIRAFRYDANQAALPAKLTVSELKRMQSRQTAEEEQGEALFPEEAVVPYVPRFLSSAQAEDGGPAEELTGAARGTAYHHVLAVLEYGRIFPDGDAIQPLLPGEAPESRQKIVESVREQIEEMCKNGLLSAAERAAVRAGDIADFLCGALGRRMAAAAAAGTLRREQPFVLDLPAAWIGERQEREFRKENGDGNAGDTVLIQGTIDAYWEEDGAYILADYKTDRIRPGEESLLAEKYRVQLDYYRLALERITEVPVRERYLYVVATGKSVML